MLRKVLFFTIVWQFGIAADAYKMYCPKSYSLTKQDLMWAGDIESEHWQASESSLSKDAITFVGAQWDGIQVGEALCVYRGSEELSFPIVLKNKHMFKQPKHSNWHADNNGTYTCHSNDTEDCPLFPSIEKTAEINVHELMKQIKP